MPGDEDLGYYSQHGEDILLAKVFEGVKDGYFVELGGLDGIRLSNSYRFELQGWKGLIVEAHPILFEKMRRNRPGSTCVSAAVTGQTGKVILYASAFGSLSTIDRTQRDYFVRARSEVTKDSYEEVEVRAAGTTELLEEARAPGDIAFMSIDLEGAELVALQSLDFNRYNVRIFVLESDRKQQEQEKRISDLMLSKSYRIARTIGVNNFWVREAELFESIRQMAFSGTVTHFGRSDGDEPVYTRVNFSAGENSGKRSFATRLRQSVTKRYRRISGR